MIIGLCGYARAGKDSVARVLVEEYGFVKLAFADPLREMAQAIDPIISLEDAPLDVIRDVCQYPKNVAVPAGAARYSIILEAVGYERAKSIPDFRRFLQRLGTDGARKHLWPSIWIDAAERRLETLVAERKDVVFTDVRFPNEAAMVAERGELWRIDRPGITRGEHESESHVSLFAVHRVLQNDSTLAVLEERTRALHTLAVYCAQ